MKIVDFNERDFYSNACYWKIISLLLNKLCDLILLLLKLRLTTFYTWC